jgi:hypothetical protein
MKTSILAGAALLLLAILASGALGARGDRALTRAEVIERASLICKAGEQKVNRLPQLSQDPFAADAPTGDAARAIRFLAGYADALDGVRAGLARIEPPAPRRALFEGFVADLGPTVAAFRRARADARAGRYRAAEAEAGRGFRLFAQASKKTRAYGFPEGVCQDGSSG